MVALVCSLVWFALWLSAFRPVEERPYVPSFSPPVALCPTPGNALHLLQAPTLFALPSEQGFSGIFPERHIDVPLSLEQPRQPKTYLSRQPTAAAPPDQAKLIERIPLLQSTLPVPGEQRTIATRHPDRITLFFSPELQPRATETGTLNEIEDLPVASIRIHLTVQPNGKVAHAFFATPIEQPALLRAVRTLRFSPASEKTDGWLDIRFTPEPNPKSKTPKPE
jgi:hypothetical protein